MVSPAFLCAAPANTVVATINTGVTPTGVAVTPNNLFAYVANNNNYGIPGQDSVSVLDLTTNLPDLIISSTTFNQPYQVTINAAGTKAYVVNSNSTTVTIIDIATNTVSGVINGFDGPSGFAITPDGTTAYVNNYGGPEGVGSGNGDTVNVVNLSTNTITGAPIVVGQAPAELDIAPNGDFVYVVNYVNGTPNNGTMSVIQTSNNTVVATIPGFSGPFDIDITPDGNFAYVTNFGSNNFFPFGTTVSVVDLTSNTIIATITLGIQPAGVAIAPDGAYAYVTNYNTLYSTTFFTSLVPGQGTVNIIDTASNTVIPPTIVVDQSPANIEISPNGEYAYVSNFTSNTVNVIALQSFQIVAQGCTMQNRYLTQIDQVNKITWTVSGTSLPVDYAIYRDAELTDLAGTVLASEPFIFLDHNRDPNLTYTYYIVGTNRVGTTSAPVAVTITQTC
jgi:YVTN family beta-propeller protein